MPVPMRTYKVYVAADTTLTTTTETVAATLGGIGTGGADAVVNLRGWIDLNTGTGTTAITLRIRRTGLTGVLIGEANPVIIAAGVTGSVDIDAQDNPGEIASGVYVLTAQQTGASGNGAVTTAALEVVT